MMKKLVLLLVTGLLASCAAEYQGDTLVMFVEQEKDVDPYQTRMIVTQKFVRIDDGEGSTNFVLFDRAKRVVYSINPDEQSVMAIHEKVLAKGEKFEPPFKLKHATKEMPELKDAPKINEQSAKHFQLMTNNEICYDVVAIDGLLPNVVTALTEFHQLMATDSRVTFNNMPADLQNACDMTMTTFKPAQQYTFGFPIQEWGKNDYSRSLVNYTKDYKADEKLFDFPEGYKHYTVTALREGKVTFDK